MKKLLILFIMFLSFSAFGDDLSKAAKVYSFFLNTEYRNVAEIIVAQGAVESAWFTNKKHVTKNNYFSILDTKKKGCMDNQAECMRTYTSIEDGCEALLKLLRSRKYSTNSTDYYLDLEKGPGRNNKYRYAEDPKYIIKVTNAVKLLKKKGMYNWEVYTWQEKETTLTPGT